MLDIGCERKIGIKEDFKVFNKLGVGCRSRFGRRNWEFGFDFVKFKMFMRYYVEMLSWWLYI